MFTAPRPDAARSRVFTAQAWPSCYRPYDRRERLFQPPWHAHVREYSERCTHMRPHPTPSQVVWGAPDWACWHNDGLSESSNENSSTDQQVHAEYCLSPPAPALKPTLPAPRRAVSQEYRHTRDTTLLGAGFWRTPRHRPPALPPAVYLPQQAQLVLQHADLNAAVAMSLANIGAMNATAPAAPGDRSQAEPEDESFEVITEVIPGLHPLSRSRVRRHIVRRVAALPTPAAP